MRRTRALLSLLLSCGLALMAAPVGAQDAKKVTTTPAPEDVPAPVPGDVGLAGAACPDIARYLNVRSATAPTLSPDGSRLAYRTGTTGTPQVWVAEARAGAAPRQITFGESVTFHEWSPAGDTLAYGVDRGGNEREGFYLISADGTREQELLAPSESFRVWGGFSRDGRYAAYAATEPGGDDFSIYVLNLTATPLRPLRVYAGQGGVYVASWRPDGGAMLLTRARGEDANDVLYLDLKEGEATTLFRPAEAASYDSFAWTPDGRGFYLATNEGRDFAGLAFYDMQARRLRFVETPGRDVERVALSHDGRYLAWSENAGGFSELRLRDLNTNRTTTLNFTILRPAGDQPQAPAGRGSTGRSVARRTPSARPHVSDLAGSERMRDVPVRGVVNSLDWAAHASRLAIQLSGPEVPGDVWVFDAARAQITGGQFSAGHPPAAGGLVSNSSGALLRVTDSSLAGLDPQSFVAPEAVSFPSHDGLTIYGLLYTPRGASPQRRAPVVLSVHGGPTSQARPSFNAVHQYLLARGYAVLDLNFRGSTGYGKRFTRLDNGRLRPNAVRDMAAAVDWLARSRPALDAGRAAVMGGSYGGYMTLAALTQLPDKFRAGVNFVGVSNWVTALEGASPQLKASDRIEYGDISDPAEREFFRQLSPLTHVANVRAPLMVLHGANDPRDPVAEADQIVRAVRERGGDVEYLRFPDEGHGIRKLSNRVNAYRRVARFLERTLGKGVADCGGGGSGRA